MRPTLFICILIILAIFFYLIATVPTFAASPHALSNPPAQQMFQPVTNRWSFTVACTITNRDADYEVLKWFTMGASYKWELRATVPVQSSGDYSFTDYVYEPMKLYSVATDTDTNMGIFY